MSEIIARCGFKCHECAAFIGNNRTPQDQADAARGWKAYFDLDVQPETIRCNGCLAADRGGYDFPEKNCPVSSCVQSRGLENCAGCSDYPCDVLEERMRACDQVIERFRSVVSQNEFDRFIAPYDLRTTLENLRKR